jgi:succinoglycan biosynthesis transport protein ExoP
MATFTSDLPSASLDGVELSAVDQSNFSIEHLWSIFRQHLRAVILIIFACLVGALIITLLMTEQFTAKSTIEISRQQSNVTNVETVEDDDFTKNKEFYETQYSLLVARSLAQRVARSLKLMTDEQFSAAHGLGTSALSVDQGEKRSVTAERNARLKLVTNVLLNNVSVEPIAGSSLVEVSYTSPDRGLAAKITNAWVEQFIAANMDRKFGSTADAKEFLEKRLAELRAKMAESERNLVNYATSNSGQSKTLVTVNLESMNNVLAAATAERIAAAAESRDNVGGSSRTANSATINLLRQQKALVEAERAKLSTQFESEYPSIKALTSQIRALDQSIAAERSRLNRDQNARYLQAVQKENELRRNVEQLKAQLGRQDRNSIQYNIYQREVDSNRQLYQSLLQRYKEIGVAGIGTNNIAVVDRAEIPTAPSSPILALNLALAFIAGLGLSVAYIILRVQMDESLSDPNMTQKKLGLPLLGSIPNMPDDIMEAINDPKSLISEAYMSTVTSMSFLTNHGVPKTIMITSSTPNEGKSTSAYCIAKTLARLGKKTLLIDADLRSPSIHSFLATDNSSGLSNLLSSTGDSLKATISPEDIPNFSFMLAGPVPPNPAELMSNDRFSAVLDQLGTEFEHIIIDAPPVLGLADALILAKFSEGVLYVAQANNLKIRAMLNALNRLRSANTSIFGVLVTKLDKRNAVYGYGDGYGYGYGYGDEARESKK